MPQRIPEFGETWHNPVVGADALVANVVGLNVAFVSYTGNWGVVSFDRTVTLWEFKRPVPPDAQACSREGCHWPAFLSYRRRARQISEVVCPRHIPRGIRCSEITAPIPKTSLVGQTCGVCRQDANEILGQGPIAYRSLRLWMCHFCGAQWFHGKLTAIELEDDKLALSLARQYVITEVSKTMDDALLHQAEVTIRVKSRLRIQLTGEGEGPLSIYEVLLNEDDPFGAC